MTCSTIEQVLFYRCKKMEKWFTLEENDALASKAEKLSFFFFFRRLFPTQEWRRGRNFGEIDGAMYRDDERAPIFPRKSGRNLEKRGDPRKFGSDGSIPWLSSSLKKFSPTIILMKMAARVPRFPASVFFFFFLNNHDDDDDDGSYKYGGKKISYRSSFVCNSFRSIVFNG